MSDPVSRKELELALRRVHSAVDSLRDDLLVLAAQVSDLTRHLQERDAIDGEALEADLADTTHEIRAADEHWLMMIELGAPFVDKYQAQCPPVPCTELWHLCEGRCCRFTFPLTTQDLDGGVVRWDYTRPYRILHGDDGQCTHQSPDTHGCTIYEERPAICRTYDCREDERIWTDYENRILAPANSHGDRMDPDVSYEQVIERVRDRRLAHNLEAAAVRAKYKMKGDR